MVGPDVGGGFGAKMIGVEELLLGWLARRLGKPVRWTETRSESMVAMPHGRAQRADFTLGGKSDGTILAYRLDVLQDSGAYPALGAFLPNLTALMSSGVYAIPKIEFEGRSVVDEHDADLRVPRRRPPGGDAGDRAGDRRASRPSSAWIRSTCGARTSSRTTRSRTRPCPARSTTSATTAARSTSRSARPASTSSARSRSAAATRATRSSSASASRAYVEITNGVHETEFGEVEITPDGGAILHTGSFSHGQGHETTFAMITAERLGLPIDKVTVLKGDTDDVAQGHRNLRLEVDADRRHGRARRRRRGRRAGEEARRRLPRGEPGRHRPRPGRRQAPRRRRAVARDWRGRSSRHAPPATAGSPS